MNELALTTGKRKIKDGSRFNALFPSESASYGNDSVLVESGSVQDTVKLIAKIIDSDKKDTEKIAAHLKAGTREETLQNIHHFMVSYLQYDTESGEKLRSPRRSWWVGQKQKDKETGDTGVDCDDLVIFSGSILKNLSIPFFIRIVKVNQDEFQHVYLIVPPSGNELSGSYITLDGVLSEYNFEHPFKEEQTFNSKGMKIEYLGAIHPTPNESDPVLGVITNFYNKISSGEAISTNISRGDLLKMLSYALTNWIDPHNRIVALRTLAEFETQNLPDMHFFNELHKHYSEGQLFSGLGETNWDEIPVEDYQGDYVNHDRDKNNSGAWAGAVAAAFTALANFDWGLVGGQSRNQYPPQTPYYNPQPPKSAGMQIAGMSIGTIAGVFLFGGMAYLLYDNIRKSKKPAQKQLATAK